MLAPGARCRSHARPSGEATLASARSRWVNASSDRLHDTISTAFARLDTCLKQATNPFDARLEMVALYYDDPELVPAAELSAHAGVVVRDGTAVPAGLHLVCIPAGVYASNLYEGPYERLADAWARFMGGWLVAAAPGCAAKGARRSGLQPASRRDQPGAPRGARRPPSFGHPLTGLRRAPARPGAHHLLANGRVFVFGGDIVRARRMALPAADGQSWGASRSAERLRFRAASLHTKPPRHRSRRAAALHRTGVGR
jgi:DNA gyrase inhibitor GyrI